MSNPNELSMKAMNVALDATYKALDRKPKGEMGSYRGVKYIRQRICDILRVDSKARWYFVYDSLDEPTGDHFQTLKEMKESIDEEGPRFYLCSGHDDDCPCEPCWQERIRQSDILRKELKETDE